MSIRDVLMEKPEDTLNESLAIAEQAEDREFHDRVLVVEGERMELEQAELAEEYADHFEDDPFYDNYGHRGDF